MTSEKKIKRSIKAIWDGLKQERRERAALRSALDLAKSGERIAMYARRLRQLSKQVAEREAKAAKPDGRKKKPASAPKRAAKKSPARNKATPNRKVGKKPPTQSGLPRASGVRRRNAAAPSAREPESDAASLTPIAAPEMSSGNGAENG